MCGPIAAQQLSLHIANVFIPYDLLLVFFLQNYKETCKQISYDCSTDTVSATCGNAIPAVDPGNAYNFSSLSHATDCSLTGEIMNIWGVLECQPEPETLLSSSSSVLSACDVTYSYQSYLDHSGIEAPDGVSL